MNSSKQYLRSQYQQDTMSLFNYMYWKTSLKTEEGYCDYKKYHITAYKIKAQKSAISYLDTV